MALALLAPPLSLVPAGPARADDTTISSDAMRTGWDRDEPGLSPAQVSSSDFGQLFATSVDGQVYAQPVVVGDTVIAATENNKVYGLNTATGAIRWRADLGPSWPAAMIPNCGDLLPSIGVTSTPVYDGHGTLYAMAKVDDLAAKPAHSNPSWQLHALDVANGQERAGWPVRIAGAPPNDPSRPFDAFTAMQRPGLLLLDGVVYAGFGSHCDAQPYVGYVVGVNTRTRAENMWSDMSGVATEEGGIWQSGGGLVSDGPGRILLATGNGVAAPIGPGSPTPGSLSESVVRLAVGADGGLSAKDFFSPSDAPTMDLNDTDLGSGGPMALPDSFGAFGHRRLLVQIGKDGRLFLLDRDHLGGRGQGPGAGDDVVGMSGPFAGVWGHPAAWGGDGGYVYLVGNNSSLRAMAAGRGGDGRPALSAAGNSAETFGYTSGSPVVTSNGTAAGSALVWVVACDGPGGENGQLRAYDATPVGGLLRLRWSAPIGIAAKFSTPATDRGRVFVGARDGRVLGFGRPTTAALAGPPVDLGSVGVGQQARGVVRVTATRPVTVSAIAASPPFSATPPALPTHLTTGQSFSVPVGFTPQTTGAAVGTLSFSLDEGTARATATGVDLRGNGTRPGFAATPSGLDFETVATGASKSLTVDITNTGTRVETVTANAPPAPPFTASGLPPPGARIEPGRSVAVSVSYRPAAPAAARSSLRLDWSGGSLAVPLAGAAVTGAPRMEITPGTLDFGQTPLGGSVTKAFQVANTGNLPLVVTKAPPPTPPFSVADPLPEGLVLNPGDTVRQQVTFSPTAAVPVVGRYQITGDDGRGAQAVTLTGSGVAAQAGVAIPPPGGGWLLAGNAQMSGTDLTLTPALTQNQAGIATYATPLPSDGLRVTFNARIGGGSGGDGLALGLLDADAAKPGAVGAGGGQLGLGGLPGVAVALDTAQGPGEPSGNFVGVATTAPYRYLATATNIPYLRVGSHQVQLTVSQRKLTVLVDGVRTVVADAPTPRRILLAFAGAAGALTDLHMVSGVSVVAAGGAVPGPGGGWSYNGAAAASGAETLLTPAVVGQTGTVVYPTPVVTDGLRVRFTARIGGGSGADGLAFGLLDAGRANSSSLGGSGQTMGLGGIPGVAVALDTYRNQGDPSANFVGVADTLAYRYLATAQGVPDLRSGPHVVELSVSGGVLTVTLDGLRMTQTAAPVPRVALLAFGGGTGGLSDEHAVRAVAISAPAAALAPPGGVGWSVNGDASVRHSPAGAELTLTRAAPAQTGTSFSAVSAPSAGLHLRFTALIEPGAGGAAAAGGPPAGGGAAGLALALLDAAKVAPGSIGVGGAEMGVGGLPGVAVALDTQHDPGEPPGPLAGVARLGPYRYLAAAPPLAGLRGRPHQVDVRVGQGRIAVVIDGRPTLNVAAAVPERVLVGFGASTGAHGDQHVVRDVAVAYGPGAAVARLG